MRTSLGRQAILILSLLALAACGGSGGSATQVAVSTSSSSSIASSSSSSSSVTSSSSSSSSSAQATVLTGVFKGGPVVGLAYKTDTLEGFTTLGGEFEYREGESVTFSIGDIDFPIVIAASEITVFTLAGSSHTGSVVAANIARLLQVLDTDGDLSNGISISNEVHTLATTGMGVDFQSASFAEQVANLVANSGAALMVLLESEEAIDNLVNVLYPPYECGSDHIRVGQRATLVGSSHQVSGEAEIINNCTIRITNFNYDGGGLPDVYIYGAANNNYTSGFRVSNNIYSEAYNDGVLNLEISSANLLDGLDGLSVWCEAASVSFGQGIFQAQ